MTSSAPWVLLNLFVISSALKIQPAQHRNDQLKNIYHNRKIPFGSVPSHPNQIGPLNRASQNRHWHKHNKYGLNLPVMYLQPPTEAHKRRSGGFKPPQKRNVSPPLYKNNHRKLNHKSRPVAPPPRYGYAVRNPGFRPRVKQDFKDNLRGHPSKTNPGLDKSETLATSSLSPAYEPQPNFEQIAYNRLYHKNDTFENLPENVEAILTASAKPNKRLITYGHQGFTGDYFKSPKPVPRPAAAVVNDFGKEKHKKKVPAINGRQRMDFVNFGAQSKEEQNPAGPSKDRTDETPDIRWQKSDQAAEPAAENRWQTQYNQHTLWHSKDNLEGKQHKALGTDDGSYQKLTDEGSAESWQTNQNFNHQFYNQRWLSFADKQNDGNTGGSAANTGSFAAGASNHWFHDKPKNEWKTGERNEETSNNDWNASVAKWDVNTNDNNNNPQSEEDGQGADLSYIHYNKQYAQ